MTEVRPDIGDVGTAIGAAHNTILSCGERLRAAAVRNIARKGTLTTEWSIPCSAPRANAATRFIPWWLIWSRDPCHGRVLPARFPAWDTEDAMRVIVLGAGASYHAGYPLAFQMGSSLADWIETLAPEHDYRFCLEQIIGAYGALDNFESILADLMTCSPGSRAAALGATRPLVLSTLEEAIREHFNAIRSAPTPLYDLLARILRPGDTIVTFNYDLGVERALREAGLWDIENGYGFWIESGHRPSPVEVLKLHGSTNWRALLFGGLKGFFVGNGSSLGHRPVLFFRPDLEYLGYRDFVGPICFGLDTAATVPAMILPALPKHFHFATTFGEEWKDFWDGLWQRAEHAIDNADEVAVIGYSLPTADERARAMLLGATNKAVRLSICCGKANARLEKEFREHGFDMIDAHATTFDGFLAHEAAGNVPNA